MHSPVLPVYLFPLVALCFEAHAGDIRVENRPRVVASSFDEYFPNAEPMAVWSEGEEVLLSVLETNGTVLKVKGAELPSRAFCLLNGPMASIESLRLEFQVTNEPELVGGYAWEILGVSIRILQNEQREWVAEYRNTRDEVVQAVLVQSAKDKGSFFASLKPVDGGKNARLCFHNEEDGGLVALGEDVEPLLIFSAEGAAQLTVTDVSMVRMAAPQSGDVELASSARRTTLKRIERELNELKRAAGIIRMRILGRSTVRTSLVRRDFTRRGRLEVLTSLEDKQEGRDADQAR
jgi:hypothetical protein